MKFLILFIPLISLGAFNWDYAEKIAAETRCINRFREGTPRNNSCLLGVTAYGEARSWQGLNRTRGQSQERCETLCNGTGNMAVYCENGCNFGRLSDQ